jgi:hypothetical protein
MSSIIVAVIMFLFIIIVMALSGFVSFNYVLFFGAKKSTKKNMPGSLVTPQA